MTLDREITDTFAGEANYSWVKRETITLPDSASDRTIIRRAKAALGLTGCRCRTFPMGEGWELRPVGLLRVAFILPRY
jgi:hypothetical protein